MEPHKNPIYKSLKLLVKQSKKMQKVAKTYARYNNQRMFFLKNYCTIKVATARTSGHTTVLSHFAIEKMNEGKEILIISHNQNSIKLCHNLVAQECSGCMFGYRHTAIKKITFQCIEGEKGSIYFGSKGQLETGSLRGYDLDYILVDVACMWKKKEIDRLYRELGSSLEGKKSPIIAFLE